MTDAGTLRGSLRSQYPRNPPSHLQSAAIYVIACRCSAITQILAALVTVGFRLRIQSRQYEIETTSD